MDISLEHKGIDFLFRGTWLPFSKGKAYLKNRDPGYPPEGGCFEDVDIFIGDVSVYDVLSDSAIDTITEKSEAMMIGGDI